MNWINLTETSQFENILVGSTLKPVVIFKHSTRCSISSAAKSRLERGWSDEIAKEADFYYLDLISFRNISNEVANRFLIEHESPQILVIYKEKCVFHASHSMILIDDLKDAIMGALKS